MRCNILTIPDCGVLYSIQCANKGDINDAVSGKPSKQATTLIRWWVICCWSQRCSKTIDMTSHSNMKVLSTHVPSMHTHNGQLCNTCICTYRRCPMLRAAGRLRLRTPQTLQTPIGCRYSLLLQRITI